MRSTQRVKCGFMFSLPRVHGKVVDTQNVIDSKMSQTPKTILFLPKLFNINNV